MEKNKLIRNIGIYSTLHIAGMIFSFEQFAVLFGVFVNQDIFIITVVTFIAIHVTINLIKYYLSISILHHLCPEGENSIYFKNNRNSGVGALINFINRLLKITFNLARQQNPLSLLLLFIIGLVPFPFSITTVGLLLCALLKNKVGVAFVLLGESTRIFLIGFALL